MKNKAEKKFWRSPELVEKLISSFLDTGSILALAKCHQLTLDLLNSGNSVWNKIISRTCPESVRINLGHIRPPRVMSDRMVMTTVLERERLEMVNLIVILKMLDDPKSRLLAILDLICQRFPPYVYDEDQRRLGVVDVERDVDNDDDDEDDDHSVNIHTAYGPQLVQVTDSRNQPCSVSLLGFWLMQEIEENFGAGLETVKIEGIMIDHLEEPWLTFLSLRHQDVMARFYNRNALSKACQKKFKPPSPHILDKYIYICRFDTHTVRCESKEDLEVISSLIEKHQNVKMETGMDIGRWARQDFVY